MRFLMMHRLDESVPEAWNPSQEFMERMGGFIQESLEKGILITGEGVLPSETGALVRKNKNAKVTITDGPFTEAKEVIGGFALINAADRAEAVAFAETYTQLFEGIEIEVEVLQIAEFEDISS